jgi:hypothetical protein
MFFSRTALSVVGGGKHEKKKYHQKDHTFPLNIAPREKVSKQYRQPDICQTENKNIVSQNSF